MSLPPFSFYKAFTFRFFTARSDYPVLHNMKNLATEYDSTPYSVLSVQVNQNLKQFPSSLTRKHMRMESGCHALTCWFVQAHFSVSISRQLIDTREHKHNLRCKITSSTLSKSSCFHKERLLYSMCVCAFGVTCSWVRSSYI